MKMVKCSHYSQSRNWSWKRWGSWNLEEKSYICLSWGKSFFTNGNWKMNYICSISGLKR